MTTKEKKALRPFDAILRDMNGGRLIDELTDEMTEVIAAVRRSGKAGQIAITLKLKPRGELNEQLEVVPSIKGTKPEASRPIAIFYVNNDDGLQREDPRQHPLSGLKPADEKEAASA
jgi:hypothetical protein